MRPCSMRKIAPLSRNAQHSNAANHLNLQGNVLAFCAECTNTEAFTKKLQAFSVIVLTLLGAAFCQRELILQALTPNRLIRHLRTSLEPRWDRVYRCTFDSSPEAIVWRLILPWPKNRTLRNAIVSASFPLRLLNSCSELWLR